jgi:hypothetical protein
MMMMMMPQGVKKRHVEELATSQQRNSATAQHRNIAKP